MELTVEKLLWRGRGLARLDSGQVCMIEPGVLPGEAVRVQVTKSSKDYLQAVAEEILTPSPLRQPHPCPHAGQCGGSPFGMVAPARGTELKADILRDAVSRALGRDRSTELLASLTVLPSPQGWRYRWRGQIHVQNGRPHAMAPSSNALVELSDCHLLADPLAENLLELAAGLPDGRFTIAASPVTGETRTERDPELLEFDLPRFDLDLRIPAGTFFQANWQLNQRLIDLAVDALDGYDRVADLFCGSGNFALPLAATGKTVFAVEGSKQAVELGTANATRQNLDTVRFRSANLARPASWKDVAAFKPKAAVLDPPRTGAKGIGQILLGIGSLQRLVWVSCDVVNTLRDSRPLLDAGWTITSMALVDMFPGTWHMEIVLVLDRP